MKERNVLAGNWKMNLDYMDAIQLVQALLEGVEDTDRMIISVPYLYISGLAKLTNNSPIEIAAQNCHQKEKGAYTGEISANMLASVGTDYVVLGHSERREYFGETDTLILEKIKMAFASNLKVIYCCGEPLDVREADNHSHFVAEQIEASILQLSSEEMKNIIIAYEPIWAIGTGKTASAEQAQEMHKVIRGLLVSKFGSETAEACSILYGGSVKPANADELFAMPDVDGGLVGGASLKADSFLSILRSNR